jgi:lipid II:glycine glycyltransferase (peptidoglycan interpeptide bridge formation enzyme)
MGDSATILFEQNKWLSAVGAGDAALLTERVAGLQRCCNAPLTPYITEKSFEKVKKQLTKRAFVEIHFAPGIRLDKANFASFQIKERSTRILDLSKDTTYNSALERQLRKGERSIQLKKSTSSASLYTLMKKVYASRGNELVLSESLLEKVTKAALEGGFGELTYACTAEGESLAALLVVWDESCMYYLAGARNEVLKDSAAMSLLLDAAIQSARAKGLSRFDFCGSSIEGIDRFFAGFGATKEVYYCVYNPAPLWWKWLRKGARLVKKIIG